MAARRGLPKTAMMEHFSLAFVRAMGASVGCNFQAGPDFDDDSVDGAFTFFTDQTPLAKVKSPKFEFQLKAHAYRPKKGDTSFPFRVKRKNYNDLRPTNVAVPRILVVVLVPTNPASWLAHHQHARMELFHHAYWFSLFGMGALAKGQRSQTVHVPLANEFTTSAISGFIQKIETTAAVNL